MTVGSLFSGIGGFDLGFEQANLVVKWQVESDAFCNRVLGEQFPAVERFGDIRTVGDLPAVDVVCAGFPCQDISIAGSLRGLFGSRSGLFFEILRVLDALTPEWIVLENVPHLLSIHQGRDFGKILSSLVTRGYGVAWRVLDSRYFGVPQQRRRVYVVGHLGDFRAGEVLFEPESDRGDGTPQRRNDSWIAPCLTRGCRFDVNEPIVWHENKGGAVTPATVTRALRASASHSYQFISERFRLRRLMPIEMERLQGFPDGWTAMLSDTRRQGVLGNAVTVPVAKWLGTRISGVSRNP